MYPSRATAVLAIFLAYNLGSSTGQGADLEGDANPCNEVPERRGNCNGVPTKRYFFDKGQQACIPVETLDCEDQGGFQSLENCRDECMKTRTARRLPGESKFTVISDFEISAPKKLSISVRRKFPLQFCDLQWDSGLICPGIRRGSYIDQFFYDAKTNSCQHFVYNGCGGNANRFTTIWECIQSCVRKNYMGRRY